MPPEPAAASGGAVVALLDDCAAWRRQVRGLLTGDPMIREVLEAGAEAELERILAERPVDLVLLDISLPGRSGLEILRDLARNRPEMPVVMLSVHDEEHYRAAARQAGARAYVAKAEAEKLLVAAVRDGLKNITIRTEGRGATA